MDRAMTLRISAFDRQRLQEDADAIGMEFSDYVRSLLGCANPTNSKNGRGSGMGAMEFGRESTVGLADHQTTGQGD